MSDFSKVRKNVYGAHGLLVAVSNYLYVSSLPEAALNDARDLADILTSPNYCGYPAQNVRLLLDQYATLRLFREELKRLASIVKSEDTAFIFFSGHGACFGNDANAGCGLLPVDFNPMHSLDTCLVEEELTEALSSIRAGRLIVILDACHSAGAGYLKQSAGQVTLGFTEKAFSNLMQGKGRVLIASSRANQTSIVFGGMRNSLFTTHLLDALRGKARTKGDGLIRIFDVFNYVAEKVWAQAPDQQHPIFKANDLEDNFPIAFDIGGQKKATETASGQSGKVSDAWKELEEAVSVLYPLGPTDQELWSRAGGDVSRLKLGSTGRANWHSSLRALKLGGGGANISALTLISTAFEDYPSHPDLVRLAGEFRVG
jgi:uncharacterized caspase-like protein